MNYIYHMVPKDMEGTVLHPMNYWKEKNPELYNKKVAKYEGREDTMERTIPTLNCKWNDVLHISPVNPKLITKAMQDAGLNPPLMQFYEIDPNLLEPENATVYLYSVTDEQAEKMFPENFVAYNPTDVEKYSVLPEVTTEYFKEKFAKQERPLMFVGVPHIMYKGSIDVSNLPIIQV